MWSRAGAVGSLLAGSAAAWLRDDPRDSVMPLRAFAADALNERNCDFSCCALAGACRVVVYRNCSVRGAVYHLALAMPSTYAPKRVKLQARFVIASVLQAASSIFFWSCVFGACRRVSAPLPLEISHPYHLLQRELLHTSAALREH